jgi:uncharacterized protein
MGERRTMSGHDCPGVDPQLAEQLIQRLQRTEWLMRAFRAVAASDLPDAWIGAGVVRDVIWGQLHHGFDPSGVKDIDVAFFDLADLTPERDRAAQQQLADLAELPWEATNQAAVHTWYHRHFGGPPVAAFRSVHDAVATWPEIATCVAVHWRADRIDVCAPHGLDDLLRGVWRRNPVSVTVQHSRERLARQRIHQRWPKIKIIPPSCELFDP